MPTEVRCPNPSCGRTSHLGEDPLGRIFRCPRCLAKLPAAGATAVTRAGRPSWGPSRGVARPWRPAMLGIYVPHRLEAGPFARPEPIRSHGRPLCKSSSRAGAGLESDEFFVDALRFRGRSHLGSGFSPASGSEDSGEVCIDPFHPGGGFDVRRSGIAVLEQRPTWTGGHRPALPSGQVAPEGDQSAGDWIDSGSWRCWGRDGMPRSIAPTTHSWNARWRSNCRVGGRCRRPASWSDSWAKPGALARLRHPRIVPIYEAGRDGDHITSRWR